jgi:hypothetical protein
MAGLLLFSVLPFTGDFVRASHRVDDFENSEQIVTRLLVMGEAPPDTNAQLGSGALL